MANFISSSARGSFPRADFALVVIFGFANSLDWDALASTGMEDPESDGRGLSSGLTILVAAPFNLISGIDLLLAWGCLGSPGSFVSSSESTSLIFGLLDVISRMTTGMWL